jgi:predicted naringenin-chalcone synthase
MAFIASLAYETPPHKISQKGFAKKVAQASGLDTQQTAWLERVYQQSAIETRYSVLEEFCHDVDAWTFWKNPSTKERNEQYKIHAPQLSLKACKKALDQWVKDPKSITHIIYVSCTGLLAPGVQAYLQAALGLDSQIKQYGITFMGCFGAFKALQVAHGFVSQDPNAVVLIVCTELCSLHFQQTTSHELQIGNALFADASAACIVVGTGGQYRLVRHASQIVPDTADKMSWDLSDNGFLFGLKKEVPDLIAQNVFAFVDTLKINPQECVWPVHPGGKSIIQAVEKGLGLTSSQTNASWDVLRQYGNTSSCSFLIVLQHLKAHEQWAVGLGFGPGLTFEGLLLEAM